MAYSQQTTTNQLSVSQFFTCNAIFRVNHMTLKSERKQIIEAKVDVQNLE